jgi:hypothetical protein
MFDEDPRTGKEFLAEGNFVSPAATLNYAGLQRASVLLRTSLALSKKKRRLQSPSPERAWSRSTAVVLLLPNAKIKGRVSLVYGPDDPGVVARKR